MTTLEEKFEALELQLSDQQTAVINALDSILTALGAPPPGPTTTLADVITALTQTNTILNGIRGDNSTFYAAMLDVSGLINTNTDTMLNNNSLNAQKFIAAILSTACACPTDAPLLAPPTDVTPTSLVDEAKCRRIQFYLSVFGDWLTKIANYGSATGFVTGAAIDVLLANAITAAGIVATGAEVGAAGGPPGIVIGAVLSLIVLAISVYGGSVLVDYANQFNATTMQHALLEAMFAATNADEGYTAFKTTILANMDAVPAQIIYTLWWSAWSNDVYSGTPTVDDSAFDGSICAPAVDPSCVEVASVPGTTSLGFSGQVISYAIPGATLVSSFFAGGDTVTTVPDFYVAGDYAGWTLRLLSGDHVAVQYHETLGPSGDEAWISPTLSVPYTFPTTAAVVIYSPDGGEITVRLCPPGIDNPA